jgi:alpha-1,3-rhamnosyl/mannosyltransferase
MEYLAAGLPVVYPRLGDLPDLVADAGVGYEPGSLDALANALEALLRDEDLRSRCAAAARRRAPALTWDAAAAAVEDVLTAVVTSGTEISR